MNDADRFFVKYRAKSTGPHTRDGIASMVRRGTITPVHRVSIDQENWHPLHEIQGWQHLWNPTGQAARPKTDSMTEPPPLPASAHESLRSNDDPDEPVDVELLE